MVLVALQDPGAQVLQPGHLLGGRAWRAQVEVHPVLGRLAFGNPDEPDVRAAPACRFEVRLLGGGLLLDVRPEPRRPEPGQGQRVRGVERDRLDDTRHGLKVTGRSPCSHPGEEDLAWVSPQYQDPGWTSRPVQRWAPGSSPAAFRVPASPSSRQVRHMCTSANSNTPGFAPSGREGTGGWL